MFPVPVISSSMARIGLLVLGAILAAWLVVHWLDGRGYARCEVEHKAALAESLERGLQQARDIARQDAEITEHYIQWRTKYVTTAVPTEITNAPITSDCILGPDGLRIINEARELSRNSGSKGVAPGMPGSSAGDQWANQGPGEPLVPNLDGLRGLQGSSLIPGRGGKGAGAI